MQKARKFAFEINFGIIYSHILMYQLILIQYLYCHHVYFELYKFNKKLKLILYIFQKIITVTKR